MRISFRLRMILYNLIIFIVCILLAGVFVINALERYSINHATATLSRYADEINASTKQFLLQNQSSTVTLEALFEENALYFAEKYQLATGSRVQIFNSKGELLGDSGSVADMGVEEDKKQQYFADTYSALNSKKDAYMYSEIDGVNFVFYSMPVVIDDSVTGIVRSLYSMSAMDEIIAYTTRVFAIATLVSLAVIVMILLTTYNSLMTPLTDITKMSADMSAGDLSKRFVIFKSKDEINLLKSNFNQMADEITKRIDDYKEKQAELTLMLSNIESGVIAIDEHNQVITLNDSAQILLGYAEIEKQNIKLSMLGEIEELVALLRATEETVYQEIEYQDKNLFVLVKHAGKAVESVDVLVIIRDITKDKKIIKEQNKFLSSISHELRTPLTTIIGYTDMLNRRGTDNIDLTHKALDTIGKEAQRLLRLVDDVLIINKYEKLDFDMVFADMDVDDVLSEVVEAMRIKSLKYGIDIIYTATEIPLVLGDYDRIKQVFINVLDNAIKYSYEGGKINVTASLVNQYVRIDIRDYGMGVPENMISSVFEAFYRVDEERSREKGGVGLGLSIVKQIVEKHGGEVILSSRDNEGTLVSILLPTKQSVLENSEA